MIEMTRRVKDNKYEIEFTDEWSRYIAFMLTKGRPPVIVITTDDQGRTPSLSMGQARKLADRLLKWSEAAEQAKGGEKNAR